MTGDVTAVAQRLLRSSTVAREVGLAVINGAIGDRLEAASSPLCLPMRLLVGRQRDPVDEAPVVRDATHRRPCVLVHGLMGSHLDWQVATGDDERVDYGHELAGAVGVVPVYADYNTGRHISHNGRELADHLEQLWGAWTGAEEISIVAHSMGGLVARSACHYGLEAGHAWVRNLRRVCLLGVPLGGAAVEQLAHLATSTLDAIWNPWTKLVGAAINLRSAGIKDLRHGFLRDEDWQGRDLDELAVVRRRPARRPDGTRWYVAAATLGERTSVLGKILGDGMVGPRTVRGHGFATGDGGLLPDATVSVFEHTSHIALVRDPAVLDQLLQWWRPAEG